MGTSIADTLRFTSAATLLSVRYEITSGNDIDGGGLEPVVRNAEHEAKRRVRKTFSFTYAALSKTAL